MSLFADRVVLITGAARGIGRGLAHALAARGARVGGLDVRADLLARLPDELPGRTVAVEAADVTDAAALREAVARLEARLGPTDWLIANAGIVHETSALAFDIDKFTAEIGINLIGVANSFAAVLPGMVQRRCGHLVAISSLASYRGVPPLGGYCASKAGVNALCDAFRVELKPVGVRVTTICPGFIRTDIAAHLDVPDRPMLTLDDAIGRIVAALEREKAFLAFPFSDVLTVRLMRYLPRGLADWLAGRFLARFQRARGQTGS